MNEIIKFNPVDLQKLPDILKENQLSKSNAVAAVTPVIEKMNAIDLATVDAQEMEGNDATLNDLHAKLSVTYKTMQDKRKPLTSLMDDVKKMFTAEENDIDALLGSVKDVRNNWNKEKGRRLSIEEEKKANQMAKMQDAIDIKTEAKKTLYVRFTNAISAILSKLNDAFNEQTVSSFAEYEPRLRGYTPVLDENTYSEMQAAFAVTLRHLTVEEAAPIVQSVFSEMRAELQNEWVEKLTVERDRLIELIPSRIREIQSGIDATGRIKAEQEQREEELKRESEERLQAADTEADTESMNSAFDMAAEAKPVVSISKGTVVKKKYNPATHKAYLTIIQWWVTNQMNQVTPEELSKKLSFMITAANKSLNEGKEKLFADGLTIEDDYSTRSTRKAS